MGASSALTFAVLHPERVDGVVAGELGLPGKPRPDTFLEGARRLGVPPGRAVVVEDAVSGVQAGRAGGFGLVIGVDRSGDPEALREGALVALLADRPRPHEKTAPVEFLGETAYFPTAPFELALVTQAPLILFWGLHVGKGRYRIVFERLEPPARVPRGERTAAVQACVQRYADRLEVHARAAPYNWFNFYDFWAEAA